MQRRSFVRNMLLLCGSTLVAGRQAFAIAPARRGIRGTVTSGNKSLSNVVVSDGYNVVQTDAKGRYELPPSANTKFIFVSVPAGYAFPQEKGIAACYQVVTSNKRATYDFSLTPLKQSDNRHSFVIWADPQVKNDKDVATMMAQAVPDVQQLVQSMGAGTLIHGITVGDIVWDNQTLFSSYIKAVESIGIPFFQVMGNHDMDYNKGGDDSSDNTFESQYGPSYYSFNRGKVHYVVLDNVRYLGKDRKYDGYVSEQQLNWLAKDLAFVPQGHLVIINLHIPVHNSVKNKKELYAVLQPYNVHIMSGHTHYNRNVIKHGIYEHNHGTVCGAWWTGPICNDGTPRGYGVYEVNGTNLQWYYKSCGLKKEVQVSLHVETLTQQKRLIANVWNWDPEWKVEWWADERYMGLLPATKGYDPLSVSLYKGDKLPAGRSFAEPSRTDHLFMAHCCPNVKSVKVVATDRFGNQYTQHSEA